VKCPLMVTYRLIPEKGEQFVVGECLKEQCAWFHPTTQSCEVSRIASNLSTIGNQLESIDNAMASRQQGYS